MGVIKNEYGDKLSDFFALYERSLDFLETVNEKELPLTVVHNDFNPRNMAVSLEGEIILYDFELARLDVPQRDIVEFLSFVLGSEQVSMEAEDIFEYYKIEYEKRKKETLGKEEWNELLKYALSKYIVTRVNLYLLGNKMTRYPFIEYITENVVKMGKAIKL